MTTEDKKKTKKRRQKMSYMVIMEKKNTDGDTFRRPGSQKEDAERAQSSLKVIREGAKTKDPGGGGRDPVGQ